MYIKLKQDLGPSLTFSHIHILNFLGRKMQSCMRNGVLKRCKCKGKMDFQFVVQCLEGKSDLFSLSMNKQLVAVLCICNETASFRFSLNSPS